MSPDRATETAIAACASDLRNGLLIATTVSNASSIRPRAACSTASVSSARSLVEWLRASPISIAISNAISNAPCRAAARTISASASAIVMGLSISPASLAASARRPNSASAAAIAKCASSRCNCRPNSSVAPRAACNRQSAVAGVHSIGEPCATIPPNPMESMPSTKACRSGLIPATPAFDSTGLTIARIRGWHTDDCNRQDYRIQRGPLGLSVTARFPAERDWLTRS